MIQIDPVLEVPTEDAEADAQLLARLVGAKATGSAPGFDELRPRPEDLIDERRRGVPRRSWLIRSSPLAAPMGYVSLLVDDTRGMFELHLTERQLGPRVPDRLVDQLIHELRALLPEVFGSRTIETQTWTTTLDASPAQSVALSMHVHCALGFEITDEALIWRRRIDHDIKPTFTDDVDFVVHHGTLEAPLRSRIRALIDQPEANKAVSVTALDTVQGAVLEATDPRRITVIARSRPHGCDDELLGVAIILTTSPHGEAFYNAFTFVAPEHRRRGLATQMKHRALVGVPRGWLYSWTDVGNYGINAANAKLGYSVVGQQQVWQIRR